MARSAAALALLCGLAGLTGCATYTARFADLKPHLSGGRYEDALATVEKNSGDKDRMLYFLERGLIYHYMDRWRESNEAFATAERLAVERYDSSLGEGAVSLITNDAAVTYRARPFELGMIPYYRALNYIYLGQRSEALVEARRASQMTARFVDATLDGLREQDRDELERTRNDAFLLYWSGMLYDWDGAVNDAFVAYRNAAVSYQQNHDLLVTDLPPTLATDLARTAGRLGFRDELARLYESCPDVFAPVTRDSAFTRAGFEQAARWRAGHGEVVLMLETGFVPAKSQVRFDVPIFSGADYDNPAYWSWHVVDGMGAGYVYTGGGRIDYWISVAAPRLDDAYPDPIRGAVVAVDGRGPGAPTARVANLARQARITFDAEKPTILFKTVLRGLTKYLASVGAEKAGGQWAGLAANIFGAVTESADTRSWLTLPEHLHLARLSLPPGVHDLRVEIVDDTGALLLSQTIEDVEVRPGDWTFISRRVF